MAEGKVLGTNTLWPQPIDFTMVNLGCARIPRWPDRHFVPVRVRDYCMFAVPSSAGGGAMVTGAGGWYPRAECGLFVL